MKGGRRRVIPSLLGEAGDRMSGCWRVGVVEAAVVHLDEGVATGAIGVVTHAEGLRLVSGLCHYAPMMTLEQVGSWLASNTARINHFIFKFISTIN